MGCNCKNAKKIARKYPQFLKPKYEKKGIKKILHFFYKSFIGVLKHIGIFCLCAIGIPIIITICLINKMISGEFYIRIPFLNGNAKKMIKNKI